MTSRISIWKLLNNAKRDVFIGLKFKPFSWGNKTISNHFQKKTAQQVHAISAVTWEAFNFSIAGTCSTTRGFPSSLHRAARYILGLPRVALEVRNSLFLADNALATGLKSRSGTVRKAAILDRFATGSSLSQVLTEDSPWWPGPRGNFTPITNPLVDDSIYVRQWLRTENIVLNALIMLMEIWQIWVEKREVVVF